MPAAASWADISRARRSRPLRVACSPPASSALVSSICRPTICTVCPAQVTEISTPGTYGKSSAAAAARASGIPDSSSWSVNAQSATPFALARAATAAGARTPSDTVEWQCMSTLRKREAVAFSELRSIPVLYAACNISAGSGMPPPCTKVTKRRDGGARRRRRRHQPAWQFRCRPEARRTGPRNRRAHPGFAAQVPAT